jgi:hypothetical protein
MPGYPVSPSSEMSSSFFGLGRPALHSRRHAEANFLGVAAAVEREETGEQEEIRSPDNE